MLQELVTIHNDIPLADSRKVAEVLGIEHHNFFAMVKLYQSEIEEDFGKILFETEPLPSGQSQKYSLLTEEQSYVYLSYSKNTDKARYCKRMLVKAFSEAKHRLAELEAHASLSLDDSSLLELLGDSARLDTLIDRLMSLRSSSAPRVSKPRHDDATELLIQALADSEYTDFLITAERERKKVNQGVTLPQSLFSIYKASAAALSLKGYKVTMGDLMAMGLVNYLISDVIPMLEGKK
jgi:phage regulator Rha-like protein